MKYIAPYKNQRRTLIPLLIIALSAWSSMAQSQNVWNNKKCAVILTYDDALNIHLDQVIPALDSIGVKGTFYLSAFMPGCKDRLTDWKAAAKNGHELGNHTLFHPCVGNFPGREWVSKERDLSRYSMQRFLDEVRMTNVFLQSLDGKTRHTFAYPCGDTLVEGQSVIAAIQTDFVSARGVSGELVSVKSKEIYNVGAYAINGQSGAYMINLVKEALRTNSAIVFLFHGVGGEHPINVELKEHRELLRFLKENEKEIWVASFIEMTDYMMKRKSGIAPQR